MSDVTYEHGAIFTSETLTSGSSYGTESESSSADEAAETQNHVSPSKRQKCSDDNSRKMYQKENHEGQATDYHMVSQQRTVEDTTLSAGFSSTVKGSKPSEVTHSVPTQLFPARIRKLLPQIRRIVSLCTMVENKLDGQGEISTTRNSDVNNVLICAQKGSVVDKFLKAQKMPKSSQSCGVSCSDFEEELPVDEESQKDFMKKFSEYLEKRLLEPLKEKCLSLSRRLTDSAKEDKGELKREEQMKKFRERIESLIGDIISLFSRSVVPKEERPIIPGYETIEVNTKNLQHLPQLDSTIKGLFYRYSTLCVEVEDLEHEEATLNRAENIKNWLKQQGVTDFEIVPAFSKLTDYRYVGANICAGNSAPIIEGTLGCFADMEENSGNTSVSAITAKHVVRYCRTIYAEDGTTEIGTVLTKTTQGTAGLDIAAAKINDDTIPRCDMRFKNSDDSFKPALLHTADDINLQDLPVHMRGGKTRLGKGKIIAPNSVMSDDKGKPAYKYIRVRDLEGESRMAKEGDSGAIICADDLDDEKVHVISMLKGALNHDESERDPEILREYITLPLSDGLRHLERTTESSVQLRESSPKKQSM